MKEGKRKPKLNIMMMISDGGGQSLVSLQLVHFDQRVKPQKLFCNSIYSGPCESRKVGVRGEQQFLKLEDLQSLEHKELMV